MKCFALIVKFGNGTVLTPGTHKGNPLPSLSGVVVVKKVLFVLNNFLFLDFAHKLILKTKTIRLICTRLRKDTSFQAIMINI